MRTTVAVAATAHGAISRRSTPAVGTAPLSPSSMDDAGAGADAALSPSHVTVAASEPPPEMAPSLADKKRLKHREYVKKSYNKKINTIESLKKELEALEQQYAAMLSTKSSRSEGSHAALTGHALSVQQQQQHHSPLLLHKYMQMADVKTRLRSENDALYQTNAGHMKTEGRMHQLLHTDAQLPRVATPYRIRPLPDAEYSKVIVEARNDILRFLNASGKLSSGASVFGWTDQRKVDGEELKFALEKHFPMISAYDLLQRSWEIFSSPERFPKIYTASLHVQFHELQRVNEDTVLFYRSIQAEGSSVDVRTVFLLTRLKINQGYMLLFRSIDKDRVRFREDEIHQVIEETEALVAGGQKRQALWVEKYIWVIFKDEGSHSCVFHFGGSTTTDIWLKEVLFIALKWENMAVGPRITLTM